MISVGDNLYYLRPVGFSERDKPEVHRAVVTDVEKGTFRIDKSIGRFSLGTLASCNLLGGQCFQDKNSLLEWCKKHLPEALDRATWLT